MGLGFSFVLSCIRGKAMSSVALADTLAAMIASAQSYTSDSRQSGPHVIFIALPGSQRDGHEFLPQVLETNPAAVVVAAAFAATEGGKLLRGRAQSLGVPWQEVRDTPAAHRALAFGFRRKFQGRVLGIGGSAGKTTTKDFIYTLLSQKFKVMKTEHSQNGEAGIPKTLERLTIAYDFAVIEIGIDAPGDMARHEALVAPDLAVLTSIGPEHLNLLKSIENVFREERLLFEGVLARGGRCFAPAADPWLQQLKGEKGVILVPEEILPPGFPFAQPVARRNAALAVAVARELGLSEAEIGLGLTQLALPKGRGGQFEVTPELTLIADYYNSNPASLKEGIAYAQALAKRRGQALHMILGDMLDLGEETDPCHDQTMAFLKDVPFATCLLVGPFMSQSWRRGGFKNRGVTVVESTAGAVALAQDFRQKHGVLLVKGSRGMALERVLEVLLPGKIS